MGQVLLSYQTPRRSSGFWTLQVSDSRWTHVVTFEAMAGDSWLRVPRVAASGVSNDQGGIGGLRNPVFRAGRSSGTLGAFRQSTPRLREPQAATVPFVGKKSPHRAPRRSCRPIAACHWWVDDALHHRADGNRLLGSALPGLAGVRRLARQRFRRWACIASPSPAGHRASLSGAGATAGLALKLYCEGSNGRHCGTSAPA